MVISDDQIHTQFLGARSRIHRGARTGQGECVAEVVQTQATSITSTLDANQIKNLDRKSTRLNSSHRT